MFPSLYTAVTALALVVAAPFLLLASLRPKYRRSIPARFFLYKNPPFQKRRIHLHACSLGEVRSLQPLVAALGEVNISTTTHTGFAAALGLAKEARFLPFEPLLWLWMRPQKALVVTETELWYLLFFLAKRRYSKTLLINARVSEESFPRYRRLAWLYRRIFANIDAVFAQSEEDKERLEALGAKNVRVTGNLKLLARPKPQKNYPKKGYTIVAASTHEPEEEIVATAWIEAGKPGMLVVVPRHPERFDEVDELLSHIARREGLSYHRLSERGDLQSDIVLADVMGELIDLYGAADLVILGGSFAPGVGGHNPIEPASLGKPIISGPHYHQQRATYDAVEGIAVVEAGRLADALQNPPPPAQVAGSADIEPILAELADVV